MKKHVINWSVEQLNPSNLGTNGSSSSFEVATDCSFFRLCFEIRYVGNDTVDFKIDSALRLTQLDVFTPSGLANQRLLVFEPPFKDVLVWYDQKILVESVGDLDALQVGLEPTQNEGVSIYIERWYYDG